MLVKSLGRREGGLKMSIKSHVLESTCLDLIRPKQIRRMRPIGLPMLRSNDNEPVWSKIVANLAVGEPRATKAMREHDDRPLLVPVKFSIGDDGYVHTTIEHAEKRGKAGVGQPLADLPDLVEMLKFATWCPRRPPMCHCLDEGQKAGNVVVVGP